MGQSPKLRTGWNSLDRRTPDQLFEFDYDVQILFDGGNQLLEHSEPL
jgi:hypothetical protein